MPQDKQIQTLVDLGLSLLKAKIYLSLTKLGKATVQTISKASNVARQDIYRVMPTLQELGLAKKILATPTIYEATAIKEGLSILLQNRKKEYAKLRENTNSLLKSINEEGPKTALQKEDSRFTIISERTLLEKMLVKLLLATQTSLEITIPVKLVEDTLFCNLRYFKRAMRKGAKIRVVTQKPEGKSTPRKPKALTENPLFELKFSSDLPPFGEFERAAFGMHIFDKKEVTLCVSNKEGGVPCLWSNDAHVVTLSTNYFEYLWNNAKENAEQTLPVSQRKA